MDKKKKRTKERKERMNKKPPGENEISCTRPDRACGSTSDVSLVSFRYNRITVRDILLNVFKNSHLELERKFLSRHLGDKKKVHRN
jgi:hypothetical protein